MRAVRALCAGLCGGRFLISHFNRCHVLCARWCMAFHPRACCVCMVTAAIPCHALDCYCGTHIKQSSWQPNEQKGKVECSQTTQNNLCQHALTPRTASCASSCAFCASFTASCACLLPCCASAICFRPLRWLLDRAKGPHEEPSRSSALGATQKPRSCSAARWCHAEPAKGHQHMYGVAYICCAMQRTEDMGMSRC